MCFEGWKTKGGFFELYNVDALTNSKRFRKSRESFLPSSDAQDLIYILYTPLPIGTVPSVVYFQCLGVSGLVPSGRHWQGKKDLIVLSACLWEKLSVIYKEVHEGDIVFAAEVFFPSEHGKNLLISCRVQCPKYIH